MRMTLHLFVGPTAHGVPAQLLYRPGITLHPPAQRGSIDRLTTTAKAPGVIALVDGRYDDVPAVGHRELLAAISAGWPVWGLGSMGALRAAELAEFGMLGYGTVTRHMAETMAPDDEVAVLHGPPPEYRPITEALVDLRRFAGQLTSDRVLTDLQAQAVMAQLSGMWFGERSPAAFIAAIRAAAGAAAASAVRGALPTLQAQHRAKATDLRDFLTEMPWTTHAPSSPASSAAGRLSTTASTRGGC